MTPRVALTTTARVAVVRVTPRYTLGQPRGWPKGDREGNPMGDPKGNPGGNSKVDPKGGPEYGPYVEPKPTPRIARIGA